jgi:hypothetical protein
VMGRPKDGLSVSHLLRSAACCPDFHADAVRHSRSRRYRMYAQTLMLALTARCARPCAKGALGCFRNHPRQLPPRTQAAVRCFFRLRGPQRQGQRRARRPRNYR